MKNHNPLFKGALIIVMIASFLNCSHQKPNTLKDAFSGKFLMGVALNDYQIQGKDSIALPIVIEHFNSITAENCMKSEVIQPKQGKFDFEQSDRFVDFGLKNNMFIIGHCLVWHSQAPKWFFTDTAGNDVSRDTLIERMHKHIATVVGRYKGKVKGWDVVNEALTDEGGMRPTKFYQIIGEDYIALAFQFAHEADPDAELYYNEYNVEKASKRNATVNLVKSLQEKGIRIDGVGIQSHCTMTFPECQQMDSSLAAIGSMGISAMITELDLTVLPWPQMPVTADVNLKVKMDSLYNPYKNGLPDSAYKAFNDRYAGLFEVFLKHKDIISRVTMWGLTDKQSWRNYWPVFGRTDYPLLFDRNYQPKPVVEHLIQMGNNSK